MLGYGLFSLWNSRRQRSRVVWIAIAFALLASVALQEYLQHNSNWWGSWDDLRRTIEEGSELLGMLILLKVSMSNTRGIFSKRGPEVEPVFTALSSLRTPVLITGIMAAPVLAHFTAALPDQERGHPVDWLAAASFLFAGLIVVRRFLQSGDNIGWRPWALSLACWIFSVSAVAISSAESLPKKFFVLCLLSLTICLLWIFDSRYQKAFYSLSAIIKLVEEPVARTPPQ
jgi:hypothetical protein